MVVFENGWFFEVRHVHNSTIKSVGVKHKKHITLIWPSNPGLVMAMPISLAYLTGNLDKKKYKVDVIDCVLNKIDHDQIVRRITRFKSQVVGISSWSINFNESLEIARVIKAKYPHLPVIMGGPHATCYPDSVMKHKEIDFMFRGEAELIFPLFLEELEKKTRRWSRIPGLTYRTKAGQIKGQAPYLTARLDDLRLPDYEAIRLDDYLKKGYRLISSQKRNVPLVTTRGCPYGCTYCSASLINGKAVRSHSIEYLMKQIRYLYDEKRIKSFSILDDNFTFDTNYAKEFCRSVIALGLKGAEFCTTNGIRMQRGDRELWDLMKRAGWKIIIIAPESGSKRVLRLMRKGLEPKIVPPIVDEIKAAGLRVTANFIIGFPGETRADLAKTTALIKKANIDFANIHFFQPLPGTPIFDELVRRGEISADFLPGSYEKGAARYITKSLKNFNFSRFYYKTVLYCLWRNPTYIYYFLKSYRLRPLFQRLISEFINMFRPPVRTNYAVQNLRR